MRDLLNLSNVAVEKSDSTIYNPPLVALTFLAGDGDVVVLPVGSDTTVTIALPAVADGGSYPFTLWGGVRKVLSTGTDLADGTILGHKN